MKRIALPFALVIALFAAASCASTAQNTSSGTGAGNTPTATAPATAGPTASTGSTASPSSTASTGSTASTAPTLSAGGTANLPDPRTRMLLGAYISLSHTTVAAAVAARESAMGRPYNLELTYYDWTDPFPDAGEAAMAATGTTPLMAWYLPDKDSGSPAELSEITSGADDAWITTQAEAIKKFGHQLFLRLAPEMNGNWYSYSGNPAAYIAAWRHIHDVFARVGATNVTWVWCPNVSPSNWDAYYPGSAYVDVIGVDGFSNAIYTWQTFQQLFGGFFAHFASFAPGKPQLVAETATDSAGGAASADIGSSASYISGMATYLQDVAGPKYDVIGVCWFDTDTNNGYNWRVDQTTQTYQAWLAMAREPYFGGKGS